MLCVFRSFLQSLHRIRERAPKRDHTQFISYAVQFSHNSSLTCVVRNVVTLGLFYLATHIHSSLRPFHVTAGRAWLAIIPLCRESGSTRSSSMYYIGYRFHSLILSKVDDENTFLLASIQSSYI
jgi:hypothetical protein